MRLWSLHPKYLDTKGLVALWRETLLAKQVLEGKTQGYKNHPQLERFKTITSPLDAINQYLQEVFNESQIRGYFFDGNKFNPDFTPVSIPVNKGQLDFEVEHLMDKLSTRTPEKYHLMKEFYFFDPHPIFSVVEGGIEDWEVL